MGTGSLMLAADTGKPHISMSCIVGAPLGSGTGSLAPVVDRVESLKGELMQDIGMPSDLDMTEGSSLKSTKRILVKLISLWALPSLSRSSITR